jgi:hypothetical protein
VREKLECVHDAFASSGRDVDILTPVVMHCWDQRISVLAVGCPSMALSGFSCAMIFHPDGEKAVFL